MLRGLHFNRFIFFIVLFFQASAFSQAYNFSYLQNKPDWYPTNLVGAPSGRSNHTAVMVGTKMIVWGGASATPTNTGGIYDPTTDTWTPTTTTGAPPAQDAHAAVSTGTKMIVWGGYEPNPSSNQGGVYDPVLDSWTATSTGANVPDARFSPCALWTGSKMIIWGGYQSGGGVRGTGSLYDPGTNSWTSISTSTNAPTARSDFSCVWTGSKMIVWGGYDGTATNLNSGSIYDPSTDTWTLTSTGANLPSRRYQQTTVWTGSTMILWGGYSNAVGSRVNTGAIYDPNLDTWAPTSTGANVPIAKVNEIASVWTGSKMIIWGGYQSSGPAGVVKTGALYDPSLDTWTPTSVKAGVPSKRAYQKIVWTGTKVIVFGGTDYSSYFNSGGLYTPP